MNEWTSIKVSLPRRRQVVLVYRGYEARLRPSERIETATYLGDNIFTSLGVTHWMYLPDPPNEAEEEIIEDINASLKHIEEMLPAVEKKNPGLTNKLLDALKWG